MAKVLKMAAAIALLLASSAAASGFSGASNVAVYWGQNSYGQGSGSLAQQRLLTYCQDSSINIIPMAFMVQITSGKGNQPVINYANQGYNCTVFSDTNLWNCPQIAEDIQTCQHTYGKKILLSIGGATYTEGGFSNKQAAINAANALWASFGPKSSSSSALRPFNDAVVDGFDLDFEQATANTVFFANRLRALMNVDTSKTFYLTAAPQCPFPDVMDNMLSAGKVNFDAVFVQFYNNYCGLQSYKAGTTAQQSFNFATWDNWAKKTSVNSNVKVFLGVPASPTAAGSGYTNPSALKPIIDYCKTFSSFGGVMTWDASQAYANSGFLKGVKADLTTTSKRDVDEE